MPPSPNISERLRFSVTADFCAPYKLLYYYYQNVYCLMTSPCDFKMCCLEICLLTYLCTYLHVGHDMQQSSTLR